jgi:hypothetical protein
LRVCSNECSLSEFLHYVEECTCLGAAADVFAGLLLLTVLGITEK